MGNEEERGEADEEDCEDHAGPVGPDCVQTPARGRRAGGGRRGGPEGRGGRGGGQVDQVVVAGRWDAWHVDQVAEALLEGGGGREEIQGDGDAEK